MLLYLVAGLGDAPSFAVEELITADGERIMINYLYAGPVLGFPDMSVSKQKQSGRASLSVKIDPGSCDLALRFCRHVLFFACYCMQQMTTTVTTSTLNDDEAQKRRGKGRWRG